MFCIWPFNLTQQNAALSEPRFVIIRKYRAALDWQQSKSCAASQRRLARSLQPFASGAAVLTAQNLRSSIVTQPPFNVVMRWHSFTNCVQVLRMAALFTRQTILGVSLLPHIPAATLAP